jgi:hypothetical protein
MPPPPLPRRSAVASMIAGSGSWVRPLALHRRGYVAPAAAALRVQRRWLPRPAVAQRPVGAAPQRIVRPMSSAAAADPAAGAASEADYDDGDGDGEEQPEEPAAVPEWAASFTAAQVDEAVQQASAGVDSFDGDLDAKFRVLSACAGLLGGHRIPNAQLHAVESPQQLSEYYQAALASDEGGTEALSAEDLPPNLVLDDRDEDMVSKVLRSG